jgi:hypothetical protein
MELAWRLKSAQRAAQENIRQGKARQKEYNDQKATNVENSPGPLVYKRKKMTRNYLITD